MSIRQLNIDDRTPVILLDDDHVPWHFECGQSNETPKVYTRGYATDGRTFFEGQSLGRHIQQLAAQSRELLEAEVPKLNGGWAFVVQWPTGEILAGVDRMRTIPLFYYQDKNCFAIAASGTQLGIRLQRGLDVGRQLEFLLFSYVAGSETLYKDVYQLQPGELIYYHPGQHENCSTTRYFRFYPCTTSTDSAESLADELAYTLQRMFERFRDSFRGKRVVVPLSGGLDSRLVAGMLKRVGIEDCVCFAYGQNSDEEVKLSRQVAEELGFSWHFTDYSPELRARWNRSQILSEYFRYGCKGVSLPNQHDFPAVMQLAEAGLHGEETVFFPGHSADMNAGSHIPPDYANIMSGRISPTAHILRSHGHSVWDDPTSILNAPKAEGILAKTYSLSEAPIGAMFEDPLACCEMWNAEQRQSKYIINSVRTYEFVGSHWRTLWDYDFMDFFLRVPVHLRYGEKLYLDCLRNNIFVDDLAELKQIPLAKHGPLQLLSSIRSRPNTFPVGRWMKSVISQARLKLLRAGVARQHVSKLPPMQDARTRLSGLEIPIGPISLEETLDRLGVLPWLAPEIQQALAPWRTFSLDCLRFRAVYATMVLAEMAKELQNE